MTQIRAGAHAAWRYLIVLYVLVVVQFFLAGVGVFNPTESSEPYDPHSGVGFLGAGVGSFVLMVLALIAWRDRVTIGASVALFVLAAFIQPALAEFNSWAGPFHPVNGLIILGLSAMLMRRAWAGAWVPSRRSSPRRRGTWLKPLRPARAGDGARSRKGPRRRAEALQAGRRAPARAACRRAPRSGRRRRCRREASSTGS
jgi:hypothetical protein